VRGGEARGRAALRRSRRPAALHGRGVRRDGAVPFLHVVHRPGACRARAAWTPRRVQPVWVAGDDRRPERASDVRRLAAQPRARRGPAPPRLARVLPALARAAPYPPGARRARQEPRARRARGRRAHAHSRDAGGRRNPPDRKPRRGAARLVAARHGVAPGARQRRRGLRRQGRRDASRRVPAPAVRASHVTASRRVWPARARSPPDPIDPILALDPGRRAIATFFRPGAALAAARPLRRARRVLVVTGFAVNRDTPETDGPPGAAVLGGALRSLGARVRYVTDRVSAPIVGAALAALGEPPEILVGPNGEDAARALLAAERPTHLVAIERPGRNRTGDYLSMRGESVAAWNAPLDALFLCGGGRAIGRLRGWPDKGAPRL